VDRLCVRGDGRYALPDSSYCLGCTNAMAAGARHDAERELWQLASQIVVGIGQIDCKKLQAGMSEAAHLPGNPVMTAIVGVLARNR
jgi:hypothetical protein